MLGKLQIYKLQPTEFYEKGHRWWYGLSDIPDIAGACTLHDSDGVGVTRQPISWSEVGVGRLKACFGAAGSNQVVRTAGYREVRLLMLMGRVRVRHGAAGQSHGSVTNSVFITFSDRQAISPCRTKYVGYVLRALSNSRVQPSRVSVATPILFKVGGGESKRNGSQIPEKQVILGPISYREPHIPQITSPNRWLHGSSRV